LKEEYKMADYETIKRIENNQKEIIFFLEEILKVPIVRKDLIRRKIIKEKEE